MDEEESNTPIPFGISAATGRPIEGVSEKDLNALLGKDDQASKPLLTALAQKVTEANFGVLSGFDPDKLDEVGWGLIFSADVDPAPVLEALSPLIERRRGEAGDRLKIFQGPDGYRVGDTANKWLMRRGASLNIIDPDLGVPYYLVVVGDPSQIPFSFQYSLDIVAAVGRIDFPTAAEYRQYAESVIAHESNLALATMREIAMFATCHDFDRATQLFTNQVAKPLAFGEGPKKPVGEKFGFKVNALLEEAATKENLKSVLRGAGRGTPSILFTGSHGMAFGVDDARLVQNQGALVCNDWPGYGSIDESHWFAASDVPADASIHGMIHFFFACYGAGTPEFDNFNRMGQPERVAPHAMTARLPQALMAHPGGGTLASLGHIDKAWASSFQSARGKAQTQGFRDVVGQLMTGTRVGHATDQFNTQWGTLSTELVELLDERSAGGAVSDAELLSLWVARDDARNYVILGDPAVKLRAQPA